ncbi:MAG: 3-deoxy-7-phosphoheptulonate synthase [Chloroflexi bacterium]|nr:3-deoxy-7-phosphoheptulonate synthase [Chloroflexota bacterium]
MKSPELEIEELSPVKKTRQDYRLVAGSPALPASVVDVRGVPVGGEEIVVIAGPCAVENGEQVMATALSVRDSGARLLRGGAFKPRTSPYDFRGLGEEGLQILAAAGRASGLPIVTEVLSERHVELVAAYADVLQIGTRNMSCFALLEEVARAGKPVLLKRGMAAKIKEWLLAAEYVMAQGNDQIILCERGIRSFDSDFCRNTLDLNAVAIAKQETHLPVIVDPSHAAGRSDIVSLLARAAIAVGADGLLIEVHPTPEQALCDGSQSLSTGQFQRFMDDLAPLAAACGRHLAPLAALV